MFCRRSIGLFLCCIALMACWKSANSQDRAHRGYYLLAQGGWAWGNPSGGVIGEVAGGIRRKNWEWGIATGVDNGGTTTAPVLADIRWMFLQGKTTLSLFSQEGWNFITHGSTEKRPFTLQYQERYLTGPYWMGGLSWGVPVKRAGCFLVSAGCSFKQFREKITWVPYAALEPASLTLPFYDNQVEKEWRGVLVIGWEW